ncbi:hypothetical protein PQX77_022178 [Marasmius sp. AFHP31]|nr:hypothetical protein PQX77_022178 [Marasmius sp. AFHP31]
MKYVEFKTTVLVPVELAFIEGDLLAIQVGAIPVDSVLKRDPVNSNLIVSKRVSGGAGETAAMGCVRTVVGSSIPFLPTSPRYAVPVPRNVGPKSRMRYVADVIVMDPVCDWTVPNPPVVPDSSGPLHIKLPTFGISATYVGLSGWAIHNKTIEVIVDGGKSPNGGYSTPIGDRITQFVNTTTQNSVTDGSMT